MLCVVELGGYSRNAYAWSWSNFSVPLVPAIANGP